MTQDDEHQVKWLEENFSFIDSFTMIDNRGNIVVKKRYNPRYSDEENFTDNEWAIGRNILEVFPSLNHNRSSLLQALTTGKIIFLSGQSNINHLGQVSVTNNITFPIISRGKIVGALEISRDVTHTEAFVNYGQKNAIAIPVSSNANNKVEAVYTVDDIVTQNKQMLDIKDTIVRIADSISSVLVYGETGTGKELVVSSIHNASKRKNKPFIPVNCAALPEGVLEGLLFGSKKGAFTGAENRKGLFEEANGGTIYLDEINSMPLLLQAKLLRVLQEKTVIPLGGSRPVKLDVRIIASINKPLHDIIASGEMRKDIIYRLNAISLNIPPLRERMEDIEPLSEYFLEKYNRTLGRHIPGIKPEVYDFFKSLSWDGNVRELEHAIEFAVNMAPDGKIIGMEDFPAYLFSDSYGISARNDGNSPYETTSLSERVQAYEKELIQNALTRCGGNVAATAKRLSLPRTSLLYKLQKYKINYSTDLKK